MSTHESLKVSNFREFWPIYVMEHRHAVNRRLHFLGTLVTLLLLFNSLLTATFWWLLLVPVAGYGFAWAGHFLIEKNRPATFVHPFYSLIGDYKMFLFIILGRMDHELESAAQTLKSRKTSRLN
jgi:hypothetical protein